MVPLRILHVWSWKFILFLPGTWCLNLPWLVTDNTKLFSTHIVGIKKSGSLRSDLCSLWTKSQPDPSIPSAIPHSQGKLPASSYLNTSRDIIKIESEGKLFLHEHRFHFSRASVPLLQWSKPIRQCWHSVIYLVKHKINRVNKKSNKCIQTQNVDILALQDMFQIQFIPICPKVCSIVICKLLIAMIQPNGLIVKETEAVLF